MARLALVLALCLLAGCARGASAPAAPAAARGDAGRLLVGLGVEGGAGPSRTTLPAAGAITLVLFVENGGREPVRVTYQSGQQYDFVASREGREVWRWSAAAKVAFTQALVEAEFAPGERRIHREPWRGIDNAGRPVPPGEYEVRGLVPLSPRPLETPPIVVTVAPR